mmetsp:Transcript_133943/g.232491  ORF Transcript_133943/g.232491 Transcript_133943/m.232491 type:complete len:236 (+) Transcript_133943:1220-1927(+)
MPAGTSHIGARTSAPLCPWRLLPEPWILQTCGCRLHCHGTRNGDRGAQALHTHRAPALPKPRRKCTRSQALSMFRPWTAAPLRPCPWTPRRVWPCLGRGSPSASDSRRSGSPGPQLRRIDRGGHRPRIMMQWVRHAAQPNSLMLSLPWTAAPVAHCQSLLPRLRQDARASRPFPSRRRRSASCHGRTPRQQCRRPVQQPERAGPGRALLWVQTCRPPAAAGPSPAACRAGRPTPR